MARIAIKNDPNKPFSAFSYARETIGKMKNYGTNKKFDIQLQGFDDFQSQAVTQLLINSLNIVGAQTIRGHVDGRIIQRDLTREVSADIKDFATIKLKVDTDAQTTNISFASKGESIPVFAMERVLNVLSKQILDPKAWMAEVNEPPYHGKYAILPFTDVGLMEVGQVIVESLIHSHGFTSHEDLGTVKEGMILGSSPKKHPVLLVREAAFKELLKSEISPDLPPH